MRFIIPTLVFLILGCVGGPKVLDNLPPYFPVVDQELAPSLITTACVTRDDGERATAVMASWAFESEEAAKAWTTGWGHQLRSDGWKPTTLGFEREDTTVDFEIPPETSQVGVMWIQWGC